MKIIIDTKEVFNECGDLIKFVYRYDDGTTGERATFISAKELENINSLLDHNQRSKTF